MDWGECFVRIDSLFDFLELVHQSKAIFLSSASDLSIKIRKEKKTTAVKG
jgi:hypothetical protein